MNSNIDYLKKIIDNIGKIVDHPGNLGKCQLCVQIDIISGLPVFYYTKYTEESLQMELPNVGEQGLFDNITFVGGNGNEDDDEDSEEYEPDTKNQLGYVASRPDDNLVNHEILEDDNNVDEERSEESDYYSYESYSSEESVPKKRNMPPKHHVIEKPIVKKPVLIAYNDDNIYKTSNGEYVKLTGDKYNNESIDFLDKLSVKMFEKTFGPDYKEMKKYTDMQTRYAKLYNAASAANRPGFHPGPM